MPRTPGMSDEEIAARHAAIVNRLRGGMTPREVADFFGVKPAMVYDLRRRYVAAGPQQRRYTPDEVARIEAMLADGVSLAEIARTLHRSYKPLWRKFRGHGWTREQCAQWLRLPKI